MGREDAELIPHTDLISKVISLHINCLDQSRLTDSVISERFRNIQSCDAYSVRVHLHSFSSFTKNPRNARGNIHRRTGYHLLSLRIVICNPCQSFPSLSIVVPLQAIIISSLFFYRRKLVFSGFLQVKGNFVQNNSKYRTEVIF